MISTFQTLCFVCTGLITPRHQGRVRGSCGDFTGMGGKDSRIWRTIRE